MNQAVSTQAPLAPQTVHLKDYQPPAFLINQVELNFKLEPSATLVTSLLHLQRNPAHPDGRAPLVLDGQQLKLLSVEVDGQPLAASDYQVTENHLTLPQPPAEFVLQTQVEIDPANNTALEGLYLSSGNFCTQCEAEGFRRITYYLDRPDVLARFTTRIEADKEAFPVLLSNGNPTEKGELDKGKHYVIWEDPFPKPCYLFALVGGDLHPVKDSYTTSSGRKVALEIWVEKENLHKCDHALESLKKAMRWDEDTYGREYDLDIYMIVAVNDFNMGAMENKGLNIFNSACVLADPKSETDMAFHRVESVVAHEYFHNWSGNRVTCRDWFQLSLKEGFTVFRDQQFSADQHSPAVERIQHVALLRTAQFAEDASPTAHPVRPDSYIEINNFYTLTVYEKGSEVVRMLSELVGWDTFRKGSDLYFERFDGQAVTVEDFVNCMAEVSGLNLDQFLIWYSQAGTPQVKAEGRYDAEQKTFTLTLKQETPPTPGQKDKQPLLIPIKMGLVSRTGHPLPLEIDGEFHGTETVLQLNKAEQSFTFHHLESEPLPSLLRGFSAPVKLSYAYSKEDLAFLLQHDPDGFNRWDAGQQLALTTLQELISAQQQGQDLELDPLLINTWKQLLEGQPEDPLMLAELLQLPSEAYIAEQYECVDIDAIHIARDYARKTLATALYPEFLRLYHLYTSDQPWSAEAQQLAARRLKNTCLSFLVVTDAAEALQLAEQQFQQADNMTDQQAALTCLAHAENNQPGDAALQAFARQWARDPLVMDTWFSIQVTRPHPDALDRVKALLEHPAFSMKNPNKVRAVLGAFAGQNRHNFHRRDGAGYQLLANAVIELNKTNPQIASRLVLPLTRFQKLDDFRKGKMKEALERIQQEKLSPDLYEVIQKALVS
ncbi:aminopeptidase N [Marinospirillum celere]|uniref:Aminopeptidase N n=1 Tax=Marinospirillum celere TaxID=1122252 RepID=A0A1I1IYW8_9GAMM|nr:aminopeptidase N [Marinospirillum celere]SFC38873.1 aminopeptidase N [Marinospirillum celere]